MHVVAETALEPVAVEKRHEALKVLERRVRSQDLSSGVLEGVILEINILQGKRSQAKIKAPLGEGRGFLRLYH